MASPNPAATHSLTKQSRNDRRKQINQIFVTLVGTNDIDRVREFGRVGDASQAALGEQGLNRSQAQIPGSADSEQVMSRQRAQIDRNGRIERRCGAAW